MRRIPLALLSAALLSLFPLAGNAQQGTQSQTRSPSQAQPGARLQPISLAGACGARNMRIETCR